MTERGRMFVGDVVSVAVGVLIAVVVESVLYSRWLRKVVAA